VPEATFWFSSPFREWLGQRTVTVCWEGRITVREAIERLAAGHPLFRRNVTDHGLHQDSLNNLAAILLNGDFLSLDSTIPDGAKVDVFTPLAGGANIGTTCGVARAAPRDLPCLTLSRNQC
jgi:molybdopterin converting factor small subunit